MSEGGTHGMTKRLKGYTRQKGLGTTGLGDAFSKEYHTKDKRINTRRRKKNWRIPMADSYSYGGFKIQPIVLCLRSLI